MIIDTHSHCYFENLLPNIDKIIDRMQEKNIEKSIQIGCDIDSSRQAIELAQKFPNVFLAVVGIHPESAQNMNEWRDFFGEISENFDDFLMQISHKNLDFWNEIFQKISPLAELETLIQNHKKYIVAIGECGLDFHYIDGTNGGKNCANFSCLSSLAKQQIENQKFWWLAQWKLAQKYDFPLVIHTRDARQETLESIQKFQMSRLVMHCYAEDVEMAKELLDFSSEIYFSFSGIVTYKNAKNIQETAQFLPIERILIETDSPFLAPQSVRGKTNEPSYVRMTFEKICELRTENPEFLEEKIYENSLRFFNIQK